MKTKRGQVTIFIILAIVIIGAIAIYLAIDYGFGTSIPSDMRPIYDYYLSCMEEQAKTGIDIMGSQAGYIDTPDFVAGSVYSPTSSQLDFFGNGVPYWLYLSGNNILKEQIPDLGDMEYELGQYMEDRLTECDFSHFEAAGYAIYIEEGDVVAEIQNEKVNFDLNNPVTIYGPENSVVVDSSKISVSSKFGKLYGMALEIFDSEKRETFLESYAIDVMRLYAPVDGVELTCVPQIFVEEQIREDLYDGLEANMNSIKIDGDYYDLKYENSDYFVADLGIDSAEDINVMYSRDWPTRIEIYGDLVVEPIGTQEGLSILGFCYVPYHFVYDISFPVMIQIYDQDNLFQFPVAVIIDNNQAREAAESDYSNPGDESEVCKYNNADLTVYTYDNELNPVEATVSFKCLDAICELGETDSEGVYDGSSPQCVNGFVIASAEGYAQGKTQISTNSENTANVLMKKEYEMELEFEGIGERTAVVTFTGEDYSASVIYPDMNTVDLVEGEYNITAYVYEDSVLEFPGGSDTVCTTVPVSGVGGILGLEEEKCYDVEIPEMEIDMAIVGGGNSNEYIAESMLRNNKRLNIEISMFGQPGSLDELQENYDKVEEGDVSLTFQ